MEADSALRGLLGGLLLYLVSGVMTTASKKPTTSSLASPRSASSASAVQVPRARLVHRVRARRRPRRLRVEAQRRRWHTAVRQLVRRVLVVAPPRSSAAAAASTMRRRRPRRTTCRRRRRTHPWPPPPAVWLLPAAMRGSCTQRRAVLVSGSSCTSPRAKGSCWVPRTTARAEALQRCATVHQEPLERHDAHQGAVTRAEAADPEGVTPSGSAYSGWPSSCTRSASACSTTAAGRRAGTQTYACTLAGRYQQHLLVRQEGLRLPPRDGDAAEEALLRNDSDARLAFALVIAVEERLSCATLCSGSRRSP